MVESCRLAFGRLVDARRGILGPIVGFIRLFDVERSPELRRVSEQAIGAFLLKPGVVGIDHEAHKRGTLTWVSVSVKPGSKIGVFPQIIEEASPGRRLRAHRPRREQLMQKPFDSGNRS